MSRSSRTTHLVLAGQSPLLKFGRTTLSRLRSRSLQRKQCLGEDAQSTQSPRRADTRVPTPMGVSSPPYRVREVVPPFRCSGYVGPVPCRRHRSHRECGSGLHGWRRGLRLRGSMEQWTEPRPWSSFGRRCGAATIAAEDQKARMRWKLDETIATEGRKGCKKAAKGRSKSWWPQLALQAA